MNTIKKKNISLALGIMFTIFYGGLVFLVIVLIRHFIPSQIIIAKEVSYCTSIANYYKKIGLNDDEQLCISYTGDTTLPYEVAIIFRVPGFSRKQEYSILFNEKFSQLMLFLEDNPNDTILDKIAGIMVRTNSAPIDVYAIRSPVENDDIYEGCWRLHNAYFPDWESYEGFSCVGAVIDCKFDTLSDIYTANLDIWENLRYLSITVVNDSAEECTQYEEYLRNAFPECEISIHSEMD